MDTGRRASEVVRQAPAGVTIVAAAKGRTAQEIRAVIEAGIVHVGENYVQEAAGKRLLLPPGITWHMIGRLQTNKAGKAVAVFDWVETVDSPEVARKLATAASRAGKDLPILIQVNISREPQKAGTLPEDAARLAETIRDLPNLELRGLMALPPEPERPEDSRPHFRALRRLLEEINREQALDHPLDVLSMGMSADWEVAVEEGATMVRLGTALFGPR